MTVESKPVQVRFFDVASPDMATLNATLIPYGRLSETQIATVLPVEVHWPQAVTDRVAVLESYGNGSAPPGTTSATVESVQRFVSDSIPAATDDIVSAIRLMAAAAIRDDGSRAVTERSAILVAYLEAKALAMVRTLGSYVLTTEPLIDWGDAFESVGRVHSPRTIYGLAMLARTVGTWAGWTDADLRINGNQHRVWAPILAETPNYNVDKSLTPEEIQAMFVPQLLENRQISPEGIRAIAFGPWTYFWRDLTFRDEVFIDRESCADQFTSRQVIAQIISDRVEQRLLAAPVAERKKMRLLLSMPVGTHGIDLYKPLRDAEAGGFE